MKYILIVKPTFFRPPRFYLVFVLVWLLGCSNDDPETKCFEEDNRNIAETVTEISGIIFRECNGYIIEPSVRLNNNPIGILSPCNLNTEFQQDGLRIVFSGHIYESFETEDICADFFELIDIGIDTSTPTSENLVGFWQLSHYETAGGRIDPPNDGKPVYWRLKYNGTMNGMAGNNFIVAGQYGVSDGFLTLAFGITEISTTEWEERFYDAIAQSFDGNSLVMPYALDDNELVFSYADNETMHFERKP